MVTVIRLKFVYYVKCVYDCVSMIFNLQIKNNFNIIVNWPISGNHTTKATIANLETVVSSVFRPSKWPSQQPSR